MAIDRASREYRRGIVLADALAISLAFIAAYGIRHGELLDLPRAYWVALPYAVVVFIAAYRSFGAYDSYRGGSKELINLSLGVIVGMAGLLVLPFFYRGFSYSRVTAAIFAGLALPLTLYLRLAYRKTLDLTLGRSQWKKRVAIVGDSPTADRIRNELDSLRMEYYVAAQIATRSLAAPSAHAPLAAQRKNIEESFRNELDHVAPDLVILADPDMREDLQEAVIRECASRNLHWKTIPRVAAPPDQDLTLSVVGGVPLLGSKGNNITGLNYALKRIVDLLVSCSLLLVFMPLMAAVALAIRLISPGPILFEQERVGYRGRRFRFFKFRSMHVTNDEGIHRDYVKKWINGSGDSEQVDGGTKVHKITEDPRIIPFVGNFIRKLSIDELPQLFNVLRGDMSLVGPRPCLPYEMELYNRWHKMRFDALPGITGLWQVSGRNRLTFDQMVALDIRYLQNWSLGLDLTIMAKTPFIILFDKAY